LFFFFFPILKSNLQKEKKKKLGMDAPLRCYSCGTVLHPTMYKTYSDALDRGETSQQALHQVRGLNKDCFGCNRMLLSHIPLVRNQMFMSARKRPLSFSAPLTEFLAASIRPEAKTATTIKIEKEKQMAHTQAKKCRLR
jgi:DNA-directed RNA polymerase subunit N (RpoN/RPB10)